MWKVRVGYMGGKWSVFLVAIRASLIRLSYCNIDFISFLSTTCSFWNTPWSFWSIWIIVLWSSLLGVVKGWKQGPFVMGIIMCWPKWKEDQGLTDRFQILRSFLLRKVVMVMSLCIIMLQPYRWYFCQYGWGDCDTSLWGLISVIFFLLTTV